jgi:hypothetical protein
MPIILYAHSRIAVLVLALVWPTIVLNVLAFNAFAQNANGGLKIVLTQPDNMVVDDNHSPEIIVSVLDNGGAPVSGANVTFRMPDSGPIGLFPGASKVVVVKSDAMGQASSGLIRPGAIRGIFAVSIEASYQGQTARSSLRLLNTSPTATPTAGVSPKKGGSKKWIFIAIAAGGAAAGAYLVTRKSSSGSAGSSGTITVGNPTVGQPQ